MKKGTYNFFRALFGIYMIWMGLINLDKLQANETFVKQSVENFEKIFDLEEILTFFDLHSHISADTLRHYSLKTDNVKNAAKEIVYLMNISMIIGGLFCLFGYSIAFTFIISGLLLDMIFIHNYFYFRDEKMKVNVLKMLAIVGGAFHLA
jgi:hypothetical protein